MSDNATERVKRFVRELGVDDVGVAAVEDYSSPRSPEITSVMPGVRSIVVLAYGELSSCESGRMMTAMNGRLDLMEFSRSCNYRTARMLERDFGAKAMTVPVSYPLEMTRATQGSVADVSARHAAAAAGLGSFGRNNLILHPELGCRVIFTAVLTDLALQADVPRGERVCEDCDECVQACPGGALDVEGRTDVLKCLKVCQPYGIGGNIRFWSRWAEEAPEERRAMVADEEYWKLYHAASIGFQYFCFECISRCPAGKV